MEQQDNDIECIHLSSVYLVLGPLTSKEERAYQVSQLGHIEGGPNQPSGNHICGSWSKPGWLQLRRGNIPALARMPAEIPLLQAWLQEDCPALGAGFQSIFQILTSVRH